MGLFHSPRRRSRVFRGGSGRESPRAGGGHLLCRRQDRQDLGCFRDVGVLFEEGNPGIIFFRFRVRVYERSFHGRRVERVGRPQRHSLVTFAEDVQFVTLRSPRTNVVRRKQFKMGWIVIPNATVNRWLLI